MLHGMRALTHFTLNLPVAFTETCTNTHKPNANCAGGATQIVLTQKAQYLVHIWDMERDKNRLFRISSLHHLHLVSQKIEKSARTGL